MVNFESYLKGVLSQIIESVKILNGLKDKPGDLKIIKKELAKINGLFQVILNKLDLENNRSDKYVEFMFAIKNYLENYSFEREIETLSKLYENDSYRLRNIRYSILNALSDKKLLEKVESIIEN